MSRRAYLWSWGAMIVLTLAAFLAAGLNLLPRAFIGWLLGALALAQILLQVRLFMHLDLRRTWYVVYVAMGAGFALVWALAVWYLAWEVL